jgi:hypothetical protein
MNSWATVSLPRKSASWSFVFLKLLSMGSTFMLSQRLSVRWYEHTSITALWPSSVIAPIALFDYGKPEYPSCNTHYNTVGWHLIILILEHILREQHTYRPCQWHTQVHSALMSCITPHKLLCFISRESCCTWMPLFLILCCNAIQHFILSVQLIIRLTL